MDLITKSFKFRLEPTKSISIMKTLYLLRHAKSSWKQPEIPDFERPLNTRGKKDASLMGKLLKEKSLNIDVIISSPAKRAKKTAKKVAKKIAYKKEKIVLKQEIYEANISEIFGILEQINADIHSVMLVGHNPTLTDVANLLLKDAKIDNIPTAGVVAITFNCQKWSEIEEIKGNLIFFEYPKKYNEVPTASSPDTTSQQGRALGLI